jgi:hypothetical protein
MERGRSTKCYKCGGAASHCYTFLRLSEKEAYLGVVERNVCDTCLARYIEEIKSGRRGRYEFLFWLSILLPIGVPLAAFAASASWRVVGDVMIGSAFLLSALAVVSHVRERRRACVASDLENTETYCIQMCREDARSTCRRSKLIEVKREYALDACTAERIASEAGVSPRTAERIRPILRKAAAVAFSTDVEA